MTRLTSTTTPRVSKSRRARGWKLTYFQSAKPRAATRTTTHTRRRCAASTSKTSPWPKFWEAIKTDSAPTRRIESRRISWNRLRLDPAPRLRLTFRALLRQLLGPQRPNSGRPSLTKRTCLRRSCRVRVRRRHNTLAQRFPESRHRSFCPTLEGLHRIPPRSLMGRLRCVGTKPRFFCPIRAVPPRILMISVDPLRRSCKYGHSLVS